MKTHPALQHVRAMLALFLAAFAPSLFAAPLTIPGANGTDGALNVTASTNIDLSLAVTGVWDADNTANTGKGIYDASKWAVVFKYSSVNIANGATVTFSNHPSRAPVVWLVNGNVTIDGVVDLSGNSGSLGTVVSPEGGPGGFRGAGPNQGGGSGFGPGAGFGGSGELNGHYSFTPGDYGDARLVRLVGGSGGASFNSSVGSGGGGAILVAASDVISLLGSIRANGGPSVGGVTYGRGSGGGVRLIADQLLGTGRIEAVGGSGIIYAAEHGRIALQANVASPNLTMVPAAQVESPAPVILWPATNAASVRVVSVSGNVAPLDPRPELQIARADVNIASTNAATVVLETMNFPTNGTVNVFVKPRNGVQMTYPATWISGTTNVSSWQVQHVFLPGYAVIQARAVAQP